MCVILTKPAGAKMPADNLLEQMWTSNPDGAGFAYALNNKVYVEKGFMKLKDLTNALAGLEKRLKANANRTIDDVSLLVHFRITTHGGTSPQLTHPFPISRDTNYLLSTDYQADVVIAHNGIISTVTATAQNSDTTQYIRDILVPMKQSNRRFMENKHMLEIIENTINSSRFTFLDKQGEFHFVGDWQADIDSPGCLYSNLHHKYYTPSKYDTYGYGDYLSDYTMYGAPVKAKRLPDDALLVVGKYSGYPMYDAAASLAYDYYITEDDSIFATDKGEQDYAWYEFHYDGVIINNEEVTYGEIPGFTETIYVDDFIDDGRIVYDGQRKDDIPADAQAGTVQKVSKSKR